MHGGLSAGARTKAGRNESRRARTQILERWDTTAPKMAARVPLSEAGREKIRQKRPSDHAPPSQEPEALEGRLADGERRVLNISYGRDHRRQTILEPFKTAADCGGIEELCELAGLIGLDLHALPRGAELTGVILGKYAPQFDLRALAADFRKAAGIRVSQVP